MPDVTETARLIVEAEARGFAETQAAIVANQQKLDALVASYRAGTTSLDDYRDEGATLQRQIDLLTAAHAQAEAAVLKYGTTQDASAALTAQAQARFGQAAGAADKGAQQARQGMLDVSRAAQDFLQGGFGGILNNLEGLGRGVPAIGNNLQAAFTTLPAILTLVGLAAYMAMPYIKDFLASLDSGKATGFKDSLDELQKTIKGLLEKQGISLVDLANLDNARRQLDDLKASQAAFNALKGAQTNLQEKVGKAVKDVIVEEAGGTDEESGAENLARLIEAGRVGRGELLTGPENVGAAARLEDLRRRAKTREALAEAPGQTPEMMAIALGEKAKIDAEIKALETQMTDAARKAIVNLIGDAGRGIGAAREAIASEFDKAPEFFKTGGGVGQGVSAGFRGKLELASAENIKAQQDFDKANKSAMALAKQQEEDAKKAEADARKVDANIKAADDAAKKVLLDDLRNKIDIIKGVGTVDQAADELTKEAAAGGLKGESAFARVKEGVDKRLRDELQQEGFRTPAGREAAVAEPIGDVATQAAKAARIRAGAEEKKEETAQRTGVTKQRREAIQKAAKASEKSFEESTKASGIADVAGATLARAQAAGGMPDKVGRFRKMNPGQIQAAVTKQVESWLHRQVGVDQRGRKVFANPKMGGEETGLTATRIVSDAQKGVNTRVNSLAGANLNNTGKLLTVAQQIAGKLTQQERTILQMEREAKAHTRAIDALRFDVTPRAQNNRRHGQP